MVLTTSQITIDNISALNDFIQKICNLDLETNYYLKKPSSGYVLAGLTNVKIEIIELNNTLIGTPTQLPSHIKNSKSIISLINNHQTGKPYTDNKCFFSVSSSSLR